MRCRLAALAGLASLSIVGPIGGQNGSRDSAGIRIVANSAPLWTSATAWRVAEKPVVVLGSSDNSAAELRVVLGASRLSDGRIAVADMDVGAIRLFDARGALVRSIGRSGRGPGEFTQLMGVRIGRGDSIVALNSMGGGEQQLELFSPDGRWVRSQRLRVSGGARVSGSSRAAWWEPQGWWVESVSARRPRPPPARRTDSVTLILVNPAGVGVTSLGRLPMSEAGGRLQRSMDVQFGPRGWGDLHRDRFAYGFGDRYELTVFDRSGRRTMVIRRQWAPRRITPDELETFKKTYAAPDRGEGGKGAPSGLRQLRLSNLAQMLFAEFYPAFSRVRYDAEGNLWVREPSLEEYFPDGGWNPMPTEPVRYSVFNSQGRWLGDLSTPAGFALMEIGADYLLGVTEADDGVERVSMLRLLKPRR